MSLRTIATMTTDDSNHDGRVLLSVPSYPHFIRVVRLTAAGALSLGDYSIRFVDDVRAALSESCALVMGQIGHPGKITVAIVMSDGAVDVEVAGNFATSPTRDAASDQLSERLLEPLVERYSLDLDHHRLTFSKVMRA